MTTSRRHPEAPDRTPRGPYGGLLNRSHPAGRYRLLDRNSDPNRSLPAHPGAETPATRHPDPYREEGS